LFKYFKDPVAKEKIERKLFIEISTFDVSGHKTHVTHKIPREKEK